MKIIERDIRFTGEVQTDYGSFVVHFYFREKFDDDSGTDIEKEKIVEKVNPYPEDGFESEAYNFSDNDLEDICDYIGYYLDDPKCFYVGYDEWELADETEEGIKKIVNDWISKETA